MSINTKITVLPLALIMAFRMLGLFMILPVFSAHAHDLIGSTPLLMGAALGIYGLTQALLQIPFGMLSDRIGRKPVIVFGLCLFILGSLVCSLSQQIDWMIAGRALQGAGAIGSTTLALLADLTRDEHRSRAMAMMGLTIGGAFSLAMILGPLVFAWFHLSGIFWFTAILGVFGIGLLTLVPSPPQLVLDPAVEVDTPKLRNVLRHPALLRLDWGIFSLHTILTALFIAIPILLTQVLKLTPVHQIMMYLVILLLAFMTAVPLIMVAEKKRQLKPVFLGAIALLLLTQLALWRWHAETDTLTISILLFLFFSGFTFLESTLPSLISKIAPIRQKGTAMGVYSSAQFFGIFIGGTLGGWVFSHYSLGGLFVFCLAVALIWFVMAWHMAHPPYLSTFILKANVQQITQPSLLNHRLRSIPGVSEVAIIPEERLIYTKIDKKIVDENELRKILEEVNLA